MPIEQKVSHPPEKPLLVIDGECAFCQRWGRRLKRMTGIDYVSYQRFASHFPEISKAAFERSVQFIEPTGVVFTGAAAAFKMLSQKPLFGWLFSAYIRCPAFARITERIYDLVSRHRHKL